MVRVFVLIFIITNGISLQAQKNVEVFVALYNSPPKTDLYWGKMYGIKTYFSSDDNWELVKETKNSGLVLEQLCYYNEELDIHLEANAYQTDSIKRTITDFIEHAYSADTNELVVFVGHDGLMDFDIDVVPHKNKCDVMVFSCASENYFSPYLDMILSTYTLMAPEAYGVMAAVESWANNDNEQEIRKETAKAYAKYQKIPIQSAEKTFFE